MGFSYILLHVVQIEQELGLIVGNSGIKAHFLTQWMTKFVPAILSYGENHSKRAVFHQLAGLDQTGTWLCNDLCMTVN